MHYPYQKEFRPSCGCFGTENNKSASDAIPVQNQTILPPFSPPTKDVNQPVQPPGFTMPASPTTPCMPGREQPPVINGPGTPTVPFMPGQGQAPVFNGPGTPTAPFMPGQGQAPIFNGPGTPTAPFLPGQGQAPIFNGPGTPIAPLMPGQGQAPVFNGPATPMVPSPYPVPAAPAPEPIPFPPVEVEPPAPVTEPAPPSLVRPIDFPLPEGIVVGTQTPTVVPTPPHYLVPGNPLLPEEFKEILTYENMQYLNGFMRTQIGKECLVSLNIGTGGLIASRVGYLIGVGINYFLLQDPCSEEILAADFYSLRMIQFFGKRCPVNLLI